MLWLMLYLNERGVKKKWVVNKKWVVLMLYLSLYLNGLKLSRKKSNQFLPYNNLY